ncbi:MAG: LuxR C-terminal-related transcriptional regulator [Actinomycetota bacterium]|nr:LuxR C-terminal-related transcriptional regulator [Actinomycetota bacterium]
MLPFPLQREPKRRPHNLPLGLSSFVGREREVAEVKRLLGESRLLTLTGPGGSGKSRLAMAVAFEVVEGFEDGVWWVGLAPLSDPDLVPQAVARTLGVGERAGVGRTEVIAEAVDEKQLLLMLDNCEHLIGACAELAQALLVSCPRLRILATSRETLGVAGETDWRVPSLAVPEEGHPPSLEEAASYEAVALFVERARSKLSTFSLTGENVQAVAEVCRRLDGIPLAIELAAARTRVLGVEQIASRLEDSLKLLASTDRTAPPRQRTLRATLEWSHGLLSEPERELFGRLSVFAGGWTLEAAEAVGARDAIEGGEVLDLLSGLVDKSMVMVGAGGEEGAPRRYRMLEPVRQYARERLEEEEVEAEATRRRHAEFFLALAEEAEPRMIGPEQGAWLERLEREHANFRATLSWALGPAAEARPEEGRAELGLRLAVALGRGRFWVAYGMGEGLGWLERGLAASGGAAPAWRAKALNEAGWIVLWQGDYEKAMRLLEEGLALFKDLGDKPGIANSLFHMGHVAIHQGDRARVEVVCREAEELRREPLDQRELAYLLIFLALAALDERDYGRVETLYEESMALTQELGDKRGIAMCLTALMMTSLEQGDHERAAVLLEEDLRLLQELRDKAGIVYGLLGTAGVASLRGEPARAARLWGATEALREAIGLPTTHFDRAHYDFEGYIATARSQLDEAAWETAWTAGRAMSPEEALEYALSEEEDEPAPSAKAETALLSARETEILRLVAGGLTDSQVASRLFISPRTVGQHLRSIYRKLGVPTRAAAARAAVERSLI